MQPRKLLSNLAVILITALFLSTTLHAAIKNIEGTSCKNPGLQQLQDRDLFTCVKVSNKLVWKLTDDNTSTFAPYPINGPTWQQLADMRDAAEKSAAQILAKQKAEQEAAAALKAKLEAEAKAAAELKAQQEAAAALKIKQDAEAAKAAKIEAEKPKVQGLTIGNLLWSDDFKGSKDSSINSKNWSARNCHRTPSGMGGGACFDSEVVYYAPSAITLDGTEDGAAVISTTRISGALPSDAGKCLTSYCAFVSGRFDTHGKVSFQYGFIEARIKMPAGSGNHPAFWMLGDNINQVGWPYSGEMDITEIHSNEPTTTTSATHYSTVNLPNTCCTNHQYKVASLSVGADVTAGYHTYAVAWMPNSISYYVDNRLISTTTPANLGGLWVFNSKFFLILNNAVNQSFSGSWQNLQSSTMSIDWVRSYQVNGHGEVFTP
jgi:beta-glucanase (GH16 family)